MGRLGRATCTVHLIYATDQPERKKCTTTYYHLSNKLGGWNKLGGGAKKLKSINVEVGITVEVGFFFEKSINLEDGFLRGGLIFFFQKPP